MDLYGRRELLPPAAAHQSNRAEGDSADPTRAQSAGTALCLGRAAAIVGVVAGLYCCAELRQSAHAQRAGLGFLQPSTRTEGSRLELATPDGTTCRFVETERPSLSIGLGLVDPPVLPGIYGAEAAFPTQIAEPQPLGGIVLRIPLGRSQQNCDALLKTEVAMNRLRKAQEMFENGLITEEQLKVVAEQSYAFLRQPSK